MRNSRFINIFILLFVLIVALVVNTYGDESVNIFAVVGTGNASPIVLSTTPNINPIVIGKNTIQSISLKLQDTDSSSLTYTITASSGSTSPINGTISDSISIHNGTAYINFNYLAPNTKAGLQTITVTINDSFNVVTKTISIYVY